MLYLDSFGPRNLSKEFDEFFKNGIYNPLKADLEENDKEYILKIDVPGIEKKDISIDFNDYYLTVSVSEKYEKDNKKKYLIKERGYNLVSRSFYLENALEDSIKAKLENGVLMLEVKKQQKIDNRRIITID